MRIRSKLLISALAGALGLLSAPGSARADMVAALPITGFYQVVVDNVHDHLFISQGSGSNQLLVTDFAGNEVASIGGQDGAMGIALSPDGGTLYVALASAHAVSAINTSTLRQTVSYPIGNASTPMDVAVQSGKVWVSYGTGPAGRAAIGDIDPTAPAPAFRTQAAMGGWYSAPELAADPSGSGVLVAAEPDTSTSSVASYDTTAGPATVRAQSGFFPSCESQQDLAVVPGGAAFILACAGGPFSDYRYSTTDLSKQGSYAVQPYPGAVAIAPGGTVAAGDATSAPDLYVYQPGGDTPLNTYEVGGADSDVAIRGLVWSADGSRLFAVLRNTLPSSTADSYTLQVLYPPLDTSVLSMTGSGTEFAGTTFGFSGLLALPGGAVPAGTAVTIVRTMAGSTDTKTFTVRPRADGGFSVTDMLAAAGSYTYTASYSGDATYAPATAVYHLNAALTGTTPRLNGPSTVHAGASVSLSGVLRASSGQLPAGSTVSVTRTVSGSTASRRFTVKTAANGAFTLSDTPPAPGAYTYTASFAGDAGHRASTATRGLTVVLTVPQLTVAAGPAVVSYDSTVQITAHLGATFTNRTVSIYAQWVGSRSRTLLTTGLVNSAGNLTVSYPAPRSTTFSAVFAGDARYAATTAARTVNVPAQVSLAISGSYASKRDGVVTYQLYHRSAHLNVAAVTPDKQGECIKVEVQENYRSAWHANVTTACGILNGSSMVFEDLPLNKDDLGLPYRIRADYLRSGGDASNLNADSGWLYFMVEK